jgi:hypothetical protein
LPCCHLVPAAAVERFEALPFPFDVSSRAKGAATGGAAPVYEFNHEQEASGGDGVRVCHGQLRKRWCDPGHGGDLVYGDASGVSKGPVHR